MAGAARPSALREPALAFREAMHREARRAANAGAWPCPLHAYAHPGAHLLGSSEANSGAQMRVSTEAGLLPLPLHNLARGEPVGQEARV